MSAKTRIQSSKRGLILDPVPASEFLRLNLTYACQQCSYYSSDEKQCMMGYDSTKHDEAEQLRLYHLYGRMAICRYMEVD